MPSVKENLIAAKALIDTPEKWVKGSHSYRNCLCALGAIGEVVARNPFTGWSGTTEKHSIEKALPRKASTLSIAAYNDDPDTTHADIMALFDRAIAAQDGAE